MRTREEHSRPSTHEKRGLGSGAPPCRTGILTSASGTAGQRASEFESPGPWSCLTRPRDTDVGSCHSGKAELRGSVLTPVQAWGPCGTRGGSAAVPGPQASAP